MDDKRLLQITLAMSIAVTGFLAYSLNNARQHHETIQGESVIKVEKIEQKYFALLQFFRREMNSGASAGFTPFWRRRLFGDDDKIDLSGWEDPYAPIPESAP